MKCFSSWRWRWCAAAGALLLSAVALAACGGMAGTPTSTRSSAASPAASGSTRAAPVNAGTARTLAFVKGEMREGHAVVHGIHLIRSDGTGLRRLTGSGQHPAWSPDGSSIAYVEGGIRVMDADGGDNHYVTYLSGSSASSVDWSPDGSRLVIASWSPFDGGSLSVVDADGKGLRQITDETTATDASPVWAPDGMIYFKWFDSGGWGLPAIYSVRPDGSGLTIVTAVDDPTSSFDLSPDGDWLAFFKNREIVRMSAEGRGTESLIVPRTDPDGEGPSRLAFRSLCWSSDGRQIVFGAHEGPWAWTAPIYTVHVDGSRVRRVPHANGFDPAFMPQ